MDLFQLAASFAPQSIATAGGAITCRSAFPLPPGEGEGGGQRPSVLLLHGIGSASGSWVRQLQVLGAHANVYAWDAPGYGGSEPLPAERPLPQDYGGRLWQWADALGLQGELLLVGHSLGALMAAAAAVLQPQRVRRLLLLSPAQGYGRSDEATREGKRNDRLRNLEALGPAGMADKRGAAMLSTHAAPELVAYVKSIMAQVHPRGYAQATHMLADADLPSLLQALRCPVTVASGAQDTITPPPACRELAQRAGLPYVPLGEVGHACGLEAAGAVNDLITQELAR